jgi:hypothetical protein
MECPASAMANGKWKMATGKIMENGKRQMEKR